MMYFVTAGDFTEWRAKARPFLAADVPPDHVIWNAKDAQTNMFGDGTAPAAKRDITIQKEFIPLAQNVAYHRAPEKWGMLYQTAWRLTHGEPHLLNLSTDPLVHALYHMEKAVRRDAHKAKAFVRFRELKENGETAFVAWHEPDHLIIPKVAPFFSRRFADMRWSILTPDVCVHWDGETLTYTAGADISQKPAEDAQEGLWRDYYRATFNPARIKTKMMKSEMPVRYWKNLPETQIIAEMLDEAPERVRAMLQYAQEMPESAEPFLPEDRCLKGLQNAAKSCEGCHLHRTATQTVFGEGPVDAALMIVGEQPGNEEDLQGEAFVGPAGQVLQSAFKELGIERKKLYITNAVKHFKFMKNQAGMRIHRQPSQMEINACLPWLESEIAALRPAVILGLGVTAGKALLGPSFVLNKHGNRWHEAHEAQTRISYHPSAVLRADSAQEKEAIYRQLVEDLRCAVDAAKGDAANKEASG